MYEDFYANEDRLDIPAAVERLKVPFLCIHGTADETVKFEMAEEIAAQNPERVKLVAIEGAGHTFGWKHPWESGALPEPAYEVLAQTIRFFG
jgi:pimeloyl-ACP methyl ester carboxylesterase